MAFLTALISDCSELEETAKLTDLVEYEIFPYIIIVALLTVMVGATN